MSYILEALRKSEQERQAGQAPSLPAVVAGAPPRSPSVPAGAITLVLLALNAAVLGYFWPHSFGTAQPGTEAGAARKPPGGATVAVQPPTAPRTAAAENPPALKRGLPRRAQEPVVAPQGAAVTGAARQTGSVKQDGVAGESNHQPPPQAADLSAEETGEQMLAPDDNIPFIEALPANIQQRLPPLRINLFAYSPVPAGRFAIIDMKRYNAGDSIEGGPALVEIRPDSLVLQLGGTKFRVHRP